MSIVNGARFVATASSFATADVCRRQLSGNLACFFKPFSTAPMSPRHTKRVAPTDSALWQEWGREAKVGALEKLGKHHPQLSRRGWFWLVSQLIAFLSSPSHRLRAKVSRLAAAIGVDAPEHRPLLSLHVRLGDACTDDPIQAAQKARECLPLAAYMPHVRKMVERYGYKAIYLATDSEAVVRDAHAHYPQYTWLHQPMDRGRYAIFNKSGITIETVLWGAEEFAHVSTMGRAMGFSPAREFDEFMADTYLIAQSDGLVGHFANNLDRLAYALMSAYATPGGTCLKPYASVNAHWCFDYQVRSGRTGSGRTFWC